MKTIYESKCSSVQLKILILWDYNMVVKILKNILGRGENKFSPYIEYFGYSMVIYQDLSINVALMWSTSLLIVVVCKPILVFCFGFDQAEQNKVKFTLETRVYVCENVCVKI